MQPVQMPNAAPQQQAQQPAPSPRVVFGVQQEGGGAGEVDDQHIAQLLGQQGYQVMGVSPDGTRITVNDGQGAFDIPMRSAIGALGWVPGEFRPAEPDFSQVQLGMRAAVEKLPDDNARKMYLQHHMQSLGIESPTIEGAGTDWYVFNPQSGQWVAATNKPGLDWGDAMGAGLTGLRMVGAGVGGAFGAAGGIPGAMVGAAAGGTAVDALQRGLIAAHDPSYRAAFDPMANAGEMGLEAGVDALGAGAGGAIAKMFGAGVAPVSRAMATGGNLAQATGGAAKLAGGSLDSQLGRDVAAFGIPGAAEMQGLGVVGQLPAMAVEGAAKLPGIGGRLMERAGRMPWMNDVAPEFAAGLRQKGAGIAKRFAGVEEGGAGDILERAGGWMGQKAASGAPPRASWKPLVEEMNRYGFAGDEAEELAQGFARDQAMSGAGELGRRAGRGIGSVFEGAQRAGQGFENAARSISGATIKTLKFGGAGVEQAGRGAQRIGNFGRGTANFSPEDAAWLRLGAEEAGAIEPFRSSLQSTFPERRRRDSILAGGY
jgi:hypothetical protein